MFDNHTRRNSLRYPGYDYSQAGAIFITICTHERQHLFGCVRDARMVLSPAGLRATEHLWHVSERYPGAVVDTFVVMPDHVHAILMLGTDPSIEPDVTVGGIVRWFKSSLFTDFTIGVRRYEWEPYDGDLWQRIFHDRIIRSDRELQRIRDYIAANPARWQLRIDEESSL